MSERPPNTDAPNAGPRDDVDDLYRRASALDPSRPSDSVRRSVLEHAAKLAGERSAVAGSARERATVAGQVEDIPAKLGVERFASNQRWRRPAIFGALAAAGLAGLLIAPQYLPPRAPSTLAQSKIEATQPAADATPSPAAESQPPAAPPAAASRPLLPPPVMAQRQSMARDEAAAGNAAVISESARDKAAGVTAAAAGATAAAHSRESDTALRRAAESGDVQGLNAQIDKRSDIDARDAEGRTALMLATLHGQLQAVEALLTAGADANAADAGGVTPLQAAIDGNQPAIAAALRRAGAR